jgi:L-arabinokinase
VKPLPSRLPRIAYFVSSHGFGHAARTRTILEILQKRADVTVFSTTPLWFWGNLAVDHVNYQADIGCIQKGTLNIDELATGLAFRQFQTGFWQRFQQLAVFHTNNPFDLIVTDIAPEPLEFAAKLKCPAVLVANFTWVEIYRGMSSFEPEIPSLLRQYSLATTTVIPGFQTGMEWATNPVVVDSVSKLGQDICQMLNPDGRYHRVIYIDAGRWGTEIGWNNAAHFMDTLFVRIGQTIDDLPPNVLQLEFGVVNHADLVKSVDVVVAKPGYGIVTECLANGTHWCCIPRTGFAEDDVLVHYASNAGNFSVADTSQLASLDFSNAQSLEVPLVLTCNGASQISDLLLIGVTTK